MDDDNDEMGHLYTSLCDTRGLARTMLEDWEIEHAVKDNDTGNPFQIIIYVRTENTSRHRTQLRSQQG